ncbi:hypothetical protein MMC30_005224 [Trapelia coarctata]|nr:hypothetical protein [Trapelia coarctata]
MPLPPEVLKLKRKRHEEPVDLLYIQHEGPQPKRSSTGLKFQFERVPQDDAVASERAVDTHTGQANLGDHNVPRVPTVRATLPGEENEKAGVSTPQSSSISSLPIPTHNEHSTLFQKDSFKDFLNHSSPRADKARPAPRRFHLTPETMAQYHHRRAVNIRIHKRDTKRADNVPVFSERTQTILTPMDVDRKEQDQTKLDHDSAPTTLSSLEAQFGISNTTHPDPATPRKRPIISAAEKKRREATQETFYSAGTAPTTQQADLSSTQLEYEDLKLAFGLQRFAESQAKTSSPKPRLKVQPKPSPRRYNDRMADTTGIGTTGIMSMDVDAPVTPAIIPDSDSDYVIDTYIRKPAPASPTLPDGLLVIAPHEQEVWDAYGEDGEEDQGSGSDSEDSNAEDYYANEYPEDEVDEEDEYGGIREERASDEEWNGEEGFSDEEDGGVLGGMGKLRVGA